MLATRPFHEAGPVHRLLRGPARAALALAACAWVAWPLPAAGQRPPVHYFQSADLPPGAVAQRQLLRGWPMVGYFQPVQIVLPQGGRVSVVEGGQFSTPRPAPLCVGMLIGPAYPLKITSIPFHEGMEVYPTIELVSRLFPPPGLELRYPVPVHLTQEDLEQALSGRYVTRVVYLEDPATALPHREDPREQRYFDVGPGEDPLYVADQLGRPMAIVRLGSRVPDLQDAPESGGFPSPPLLVFPDAPRKPSSRVSDLRAGMPASAVERRGPSVPRTAQEARSAANSRPAENRAPQ